MRIPDRAESPAAADTSDTVTAVTSCPFCASDQVTTTIKKVSASTYWRCHACGEIWNPGRAAAVAPPFRSRHW